ncbi:unannotated protein [freshwater metagenome]|uniref:Unannotated protein n=1 Tax=freshwater metagenome TaxID=449393 RepID=A0A6J7L3C2_9ZZZZ
MLDHWQQRFDVCSRLDGHGGKCACIANALRQRNSLVRGLQVECDALRSRFGIPNGKLVNVFDHQVHIEWEFGDFQHATDHWKAKGEVRNEVSVHDIDVDRIGVGYRCEFALQIREIGRKNARVDVCVHVFSLLS